MKQEFVAFLKEGRYNPEDPADAVAIAAWYVGPNITRIAQFLDKPKTWCREPARRLREQGIWRGRYIVVQEEDAEGLAIELALHALVAAGYLEIKR